MTDEVSPFILNNHRKTPQKSEQCDVFSRYVVCRLAANRWSKNADISTSTYSRSTLRQSLVLPPPPHFYY